MVVLSCLHQLMDVYVTNFENFVDARFCFDWCHNFVSIITQIRGEAWNEAHNLSVTFNHEVTCSELPCEGNQLPVIPISVQDSSEQVCQCLVQMGCGVNVV
jgi:hypothetical protein